ncbi:MAG: UDP-N-acetylmuramoyl-tripeptide--D-alanyl-D-alanine ligase [Nitrospirae bacterium]|nr:MAG: UDP-N-acetylmuramoyl-tripeptide--D-alanyl-D-alanine ligase [Nitrospirota bacterium]
MGAVTGSIAEQPALRPGQPYPWDVMPLFTVEEILEVTGARVLASGAGRLARSGFRRLCTDSRQIRRGDLFVGLPGERFNGREFVEAAIRKGAAGALIQGQSWGKTATKPIFGVPDAVLAYQQLAAHHRQRFSMPLVAVTGSNGKTTCKEMTASVLAERGSVLKTEGNFNNRIGVPQTLLRLTQRHDAAVVEMGVDRKGQTTRLCEIAHPTIGLITNIGPDHLEFFGSLDDSAHAKAELLDWIPEDGTAVLNADDAYFDYLASRARCRVLPFGQSSRALIRAADVTMDLSRGTTFSLILPDRARGTKVQLAAHGVHNLSNALAAAAVGHALGMSGAAIARGLGHFRPAEMRSQVTVCRGITIINDCYNANPASMKAALTLLAELAGGGGTIAALGDMLELGPESPALHRDVGVHLASRGITQLIACGPLARNLAAGARSAGMEAGRIHTVADSSAAADLCKELARAGDVVLVKGSRGMTMERVVETLMKGD